MIYKNNCYESALFNTPKNLTFTFTRNLTIGHREEITYTVFKDVYENISKIPKSIRYYPDIDPIPTEKDFVLKNIDNQFQIDFLKDLVDKIKKLSDDKDEQARIAMSVVQMIPYDYKSVDNNNVSGKYGYEVMYTYKGVCGEKSQLMIHLLRELGYGTAYMVFEEENHAAAAIKCPKNYSYKETGYCFIEATDIALVGQSNNDYVNVGKLSYNPVIIPISDGLEYEDIIKQVEDAKEEVKKGTRSEITDRNGAVILRKNGDYYNVLNYGDIIIKYPN